MLLKTIVELRMTRNSAIEVSAEKEKFGPYISNVCDLIVNPLQIIQTIRFDRFMVCIAQITPTRK